MSTAWRESRDHNVLSDQISSSMHPERWLLGQIDHHGWRETGTGSLSRRVASVCLRQPISRGFSTAGLIGDARPAHWWPDMPSRGQRPGPPPPAPAQRWPASMNAWCGFSRRELKEKKRRGNVVTTCRNRDRTTRSSNFVLARTEPSIRIQTEVRAGSVSINRCRCTSPRVDPCCMVSDWVISYASSVPGYQAM